MSTYYDLREFINGHGGVNNVTFIVPMRPIRTCGIIAFTTSSDRNVPVEMRIKDLPDEDNHSLSGGYKVDLTPADPRLDTHFGTESFYQSDLMGMVNDGRIKVKIIEQTA